MAITKIKLDWVIPVPHDSRGRYWAYYLTSDDGRIERGELYKVEPVYEDFDGAIDEVIEISGLDIKPDQFDRVVWDDGRRLAVWDKPIDELVRVQQKGCGMKMLEDLLIACTRDNLGRHFTEWLGWESLEDLGLIIIDRPVHEATGIVYDKQHWRLEVTQWGLEIASLVMKLRDFERAAQARRKAESLVELTQGTMSLEGQGLSQKQIDQLIAATTQKLLDGPPEDLWG